MEPEVADDHTPTLKLVIWMNFFRWSELASCSKWRMEVEEDINLLLCVFVMNMKMIELHCLYIVKPYVLYIVNLGYSVMRRISSGDSSALFWDSFIPFTFIMLFRLLEAYLKRKKAVIWQGLLSYTHDVHYMWSKISLQKLFGQLCINLCVCKFCYIWKCPHKYFCFNFLKHVHCN